MTLRESILKNSGLIFEAENETDHLEELKKLINGEMIASMQYSIASQAVVGSNNLSYLQEHFSEHAKEEMGHYNSLVAALMQRGGKVECNLMRIGTDALPKTEELTELSTDELKDFFIRAEKNAIEAYQTYYDKIENNDKDLADIINGIISDERDHKLDFEKLNK